MTRSGGWNVIATQQAPVYVNWGRLVAECATPGCGDAREVEIGWRSMTCVSGHGSELEWPGNMPAILAALAERISDKRRNWFPAGHTFALALGYPVAQTPDELRAETAAGEAADAQAIADKRQALIAELRGLGSTDDLIRDIREATL